MIGRFWFDTGVRVAAHNPPAAVMPGNKVSPYGILLIPFDCADVPAGARFMYGADAPDLENGRPWVVCREIVGGNLLSKYAYFDARGPCAELERLPGGTD